MRPHVVRRRKPVAVYRLFGNDDRDVGNSSELYNDSYVLLADFDRTECERRSSSVSFLCAAFSVSFRDGVRDCFC